jgi:hypothetical protein
VVVAASLFPWARSGQATRTSHELVRAAVRLELLTPWVQRIALAWYVAPAAVGLAWLAAGVDRVIVAALTCAAVAGFGLLLAVTVLRSPLSDEPALTVAVVAGVVALGSALVALASLRARR